MRRLYRSDPAAFETTYGSRGHLVLGMYDQARDALTDPDTDTEDDPDTSPEAA